MIPVVVMPIIVAKMLQKWKRFKGNKQLRAKIKFVVVTEEEKKKRSQAINKDGARQQVKKIEASCQMAS